MSQIIPHRILLLALLAFPAAVLARGQILDTHKSSTASSIDVISGEEMANRGTRSVEDFLDMMPDAATPTDGSGTGTETGGAILDLRGLGSNRTLVLINGRRQTLDSSQAIDINTVPAALIERVEVLNDGASAIYGADATAGVINIITRGDPVVIPGTENFDAGQLISPVSPALGIYNEFVQNFTGSVDSNLVCDFGNGALLPGTYLMPWIDGSAYEQDGFNFMIPFDQPADPSPVDTSANNADTADNSPDDSDPTNGSPPPKTKLQQWDRGVPSWSLVVRSPEVAHLLEDLKPYYDLRLEMRDKMSELGYWELSDYELQQNKPAYDAARETWKGTRREILTLLGPYMDPAIAAAANNKTADTTATPPTESQLNLHVGISGIHGSLGAGSNFTFKGNYDALVPDATLGGDYRSLDTHVFLAELKYNDDGSAQSVPATGTSISPLYPYERKVALPLNKLYKDPEFNSDLCSDRAWAAEDGSLQYGDLSTDIDGYLKNYYEDEYIAPRIGTSYTGQGEAPAWTSSTNRFLDYDRRAELRAELRSRFYDKDTGWNIGALQEQYGDPTKTEFDWGYVPTDYRVGYNLKAGRASITIPVERYEAETFRTEGASLSGLPLYGDGPIVRDWTPYFSSRWSIDDKHYFNFRWPEGQKPASDLGALFSADSDRENDFCATEAFPVNTAIGSVINGQRIDDQWFMERIAVKNAGPGEPVVVAVIDTGLDYHHYDIDWDNIWRNADEIPDNGIDDDNNGYVDDMIGWDFTDMSNTPWDHDGHGTFVTGLIAADGSNTSGIAGINPDARIMVLKALNNFGHTRASWLAQAIVYAADNGARVINLSAAGPGLPQFVQDAIDYADRKGALVFVAAGNSAENVDGIGPAGLDKVITVAATGLDDQRAPFSNWGARIDIAAPGMHIKSLRARQTDFRLTSADTPYKRGTAVLGGDRRYYRADGTSFAAPLVAGAASLLWSRNPGLTPAQVRRMLEQSARDIDTPGRDQYTGYGLLNTAAALSADPNYYSIASIDSVAIATVDGKQVARVTGTAAANKFEGATLEIGAGDEPSEWRQIGKKLKQPVSNGVLGDISPADLQGAPVWTVRIVTEHKNKSRREGRYRLNIG